VRVLIPTPLGHLPLIAAELGREHDIVGAAGESEADLLAAVPGIDALVATGMDVSAAVIETGDRLQVIGTPQVGFDRIDVAAATRWGIPVISSAGLAATAVAEFAVGLMISLSRRINLADRDLRAEGWKSRPTYAQPDRLLGREVRGTTVGVVGLGMIGSELARIAKAALGCRVLGFDPNVPASDLEGTGIEKVDDLKEIAANADFVVLHVPLVEATRHLIDAEFLAAMKPTAYVLNVARGGVIDEDALATALREGQIAGGALDVFEDEPLAADSPLVGFDSLILTPHIAGVTHEWNEQRARAFAERVAQVLRGEKPGGLANPEVWPAFEQRRGELAAA
jgi:D-3-phosphoglycerate dehydrogenase / 2-oxoglutarate reductase